MYSVLLIDLVSDLKAAQDLPLEQVQVHITGTCTPRTSTCSSRTGTGTSRTCTGTPKTGTYTPIASTGTPRRGTCKPFYKPTSLQMTTRLLKTKILRREVLYLVS